MAGLEVDKPADEALPRGSHPPVQHSASHAQEMTVAAALALAGSLQEASGSPCSQDGASQNTGDAQQWSTGPNGSPCSQDGASQNTGDARPGTGETVTSPSSMQRRGTASSDTLGARPEASAGDGGQDPRGAKRPPAVPHGGADAPALRKQRSSYSLCPDGVRHVEGFEMQGLVVARCEKKLPKTQSWCFVPLIYSALGRVPDPLRREGVSTEEQIQAAQENWSQLFSHWGAWRAELRKSIDAYGAARFEHDFLPRVVGNPKSWTTSMVYGEPRTFGRLPHPQGRRQDAILNLLPCETQNQIFASIITITAA